MSCQISGDDVAQLGVTMRAVAEEHLVDLAAALQKMIAEPGRLSNMHRKGRSIRSRPAVRAGC